MLRSNVSVNIVDERSARKIEHPPEIGSRIPRSPLSPFSSSIYTTFRSFFTPTIPASSLPSPRPSKLIFTVTRYDLSRMAPSSFSSLPSPINRATHDERAIKIVRPHERRTSARPLAGIDKSSLFSRGKLVIPPRPKLQRERASALSIRETRGSRAGRVLD